MRASLKVRQEMLVQMFLRVDGCESIRAQTGNGCAL